ncbi:MAG: alanine racemase [Acidobacteriota bacterium]
MRTPAAERGRPAMSEHHHNVWIEVSRSAYAHNLSFFRQLVGPQVELAAVVKSNAYGHGVEQIAPLATTADSFCVHALEEALKLREAGFSRDILILGPVPIEDLERVAEHDLRVALFTRESAERLAEIARRRQHPVRVHLKLETGTHRQGIEASKLDGFADLLRDNPLLMPEGLYTHFANIEDTTDHHYAEHQLATFHRMIEQLRAAGIDPPKRHAACSAATLVVPKTHFNMVRLGISQYGMWSSKETYLSYRLEQPKADATLLPVLTWKTRITQLKQVPAGAFVGYGCAYQTTRSTRIAILPIGYADGYDRRLSNQAYVLIHGRRAPVRGRICMNLSMVDVTDIPDAVLGDEVVLLGRQGDQSIAAEHLASLAGTIHYEILTRINWDLPRLLVD